MKKQRTNDPRFLGALGFLGFLGFLGSQNPGIMRWAWLSLLSFLSLLVLLPTQNAATAIARLHPKRKWMLLMLGCLGFLFFLAKEGQPYVGLAALSILSQAAVTHKPSEDPEKRRTLKRRGAILGGIIGVTVGIVVGSGVLASPLAALLLGALFVLLLPSLLPFIPMIEGRERLPLRELFPVLLLLLPAIILPVGGMVWFMTAAMRNERAAVQQQIFELQKGQITTAQKRMDEQIDAWIEQSGAYADGFAPERFDRLVREQFADSVLILCESGDHFAYPEFAAAGSPEPPAAEGLELQQTIRSLIREQRWAEARAQLERMASEPALHAARDASGRRILPALQLFYLQSHPDADLLEALRATVTDYTQPMPSARRLFFLQALSELGADVEPWRTAESVAAEIEPYAGTLPAFLNDDKLIRLEESDLWALPNAEAKTFAVFREAGLVARLQRVVDDSVAVEGIRIALERKTPGSDEVGITMTGSVLLGEEWHLRLYETDNDRFSDRTARRVTGYIWTGLSVVSVMGILSGLLIRSLLLQQRLTRMKNDFVANVTHELKTPLASTRLLVDTLLEGRCRDERQQREYLELIARENKRLSRLIDNFLTFSRMERNKRSFNFEEASPRAIAEAAVAAVQERFERSGCRLAVDIDQNLPQITADRDAMVTVLLNLLDNACKYTDADKQIRLRVYEAEGKVCFAVQDNGIGMARREWSKIMERFYQVDQSMTRKVGGAGLGLSIVHFIVEAHGGAVDIESELGKGSCFTVKIPLNGGRHGQ